MSQTGACLGVLTLGQSPRRDVTPTLQVILGEAVRIREAGGLDGLSPAAIDALTPRAGEVPIETRLNTGKAILLSKARLLPRLVAAAEALQANCQRVLLLCSGNFPDLTAACPGIIQPVTLLRGIVGAVAREKTLGVIGPASDMARAPDQWAPLAGRVICAAASPYDPLPAAEAAGWPPKGSILFSLTIWPSMRNTAGRWPPRPRGPSSAPPP